MEQINSGGRVIAFVRDLFFGVRLEAMGKKLGHGIETVHNETEFEARLVEKAFQAALIDLSVGEDAISAIGAAKAHGVRTISFGSHKEYDAHDAARQAGSDVVLTNAQVASGRLAEELSTVFSTQPQED